MVYRSRRWSHLWKVNSRRRARKGDHKIFISLSTTQRLLKILMAALGLSPDKYETYKHQPILPEGIELQDIRPKDRATLAKVCGALFGEENVKQDYSWNDLNWAWNYFSHTYNSLFQLVGLMSWEQLETIIGTYNYRIPLLNVAQNNDMYYYNYSFYSNITCLARTELQSIYDCNQNLPLECNPNLPMENTEEFEEIRAGLYCICFMVQFNNCQTFQKFQKTYKLEEEGLSYNIKASCQGQLHASLRSCKVTVQQDDVECYLTKFEPSFVWASIGGNRSQELKKNCDNCWVLEFDIYPTQLSTFKLWLDFNGNQKGKTIAAHQLSSLYFYKELTDVEFLLPKDGSIFRGHAPCLAVRSPVFAAILHGQKDKLMKEIIIEDMDSKIFKILLKYIYTGELIQPVDVNTAKLLCQAAAEYQIDNLREELYSD